MKRDMDMIRDLLLGIESGKSQFNELLGDNVSDEHAKFVQEQLRLLIEDAGFVQGISMPMRGWNLWQDLKLTWAGHDFLDSVRDPEVWKKTKSGVLEAGGFTVELLKDLAKGFIKQQIEERTGVKL